MGRLIDADALKAAMKAVKSGPDIALSTYLIRIIAKILDGAPTVDAVPVVRCRDCKNWETDWKPNHSIDGEHFCPMISLVTSWEWFCAYGERRDDRG